ncbi:copper radical oxidase [Moniliophthora roreri MCA 2997]|uniref:Copper radical oxidase n=2 Tax=Moniliophthora roreri TaxID=221103 RepID=V2WTE6_MONRO|nr:copper radical oxidase [Moniliophthora roreri MCA 2997]
MPTLTSTSAFLLLTLVQGIAAAKSHQHQHQHVSQRDTQVQALPGNWSSVGCFTDLSTARTLQGQSTSSDNNMTIEACISTCEAADFIFAGVEFGQECYCDSTIQSPGTQVSLDECNLPCTGAEDTETCGGSGRIHVFGNGQKGPSLEQVVNDAKLGIWEFEGCFIDSPTTRVLGVPLGVPEGVTAKGCVVACSDAGFIQAGVEDGHECWCDTITTSQFSNLNATKAPDTDCRGVCVVDHGEYCGNANRIAVYRLNETATTSCVGSIGSNFTLVAASDDGHEEPLKVVVAEMTASGVWGVLSACPLCCSDYPSLSLENGVIMPHSSSNPNQIMKSIPSLSPGDSPAFATIAGGTGYCAVNDNLLSFGGKIDGFALCRNTSALAGGRMDVVFEPKAGHENYVLEECRSVVIKIIGAS